MALTLLKTGAKLGIVGGAVYLTCNQDVWSSSDKGITALSRFKTTYAPTELQKLPSLEEINTKAKDKWNSGVQSAFSGIAGTPDLLSEYSKKAVDEVKKNLK